MVTRRVGSRKEELVRKWFNALDHDGNGVVDPVEFFMFALREAMYRAEKMAAEERADGRPVHENSLNTTMVFKALFKQVTASYFTFPSSSSHLSP